MKLLVATFISVGLALALAACAGTAPVTEAPPSPSATEAVTAAATVAAAASPTPAPAKTEPAAVPSEQAAATEQAAVPSEQAAATEQAAVPSEQAAATEQAIVPSGQTTPTEQATPAYPTPNPNPVCAASQVPTDDKVPPVTDADWVKGPADAKVTIIEYADFQCPACAGVGPLLNSLLDAQKGNVRLVYRYFPLITIHDKAMITAEAAEAAGAQGKFWEMHDLIFQGQDAWTAKPVTDTVDVLVGYAKELSLDVETFRAALTNKTYEAKVKKQYDEATALGLPGTPSLIVNNIHYPMDQLGISDVAFAFFIDYISYNVPPPTVIEKGKQYQATIKTDKGDIVIDLLADKTPLTVNNFVYLAKQGWYDNTIFHRVIPGFVAQGGDRTATGAGRPGYSCSDELNPALAFDGPGVVGMANSGPNTNGSQFFITMDAQPSLNGVHTVFGRVTSGMDVVKSLTARDPQKVAPDAPGDRIVSITIQEK